MEERDAPLRVMAVARVSTMGVGPLSSSCAITSSMSWVELRRLRVDLAGAMACLRLTTAEEVEHDDEEGDPCLTALRCSEILVCRWVVLLRGVLLLALPPAEDVDDELEGVGVEERAKAGAAGRYEYRRLCCDLLLQGVALLYEVEEAGERSWAAISSRWKGGERGERGRRRCAEGAGVKARS